MGFNGSKHSFPGQPGSPKLSMHILPEIHAADWAQNGTIGRKKPPFSFNGTYVKWDLPTGNLTWLYMATVYIIYAKWPI